MALTQKGALEEERALTERSVAWSPGGDKGRGKIGKTRHAAGQPFERNLPGNPRAG
jgi:hypothetical protein